MMPTAGARRKPPSAHPARGSEAPHAYACASRRVRRGEAHGGVGAHRWRQREDERSGYRRRVYWPWARAGVLWACGGLAGLTDAYAYSCRHALRHVLRHALRHVLRHATSPLGVRGGGDRGGLCTL